MCWSLTRSARADTGTGEGGPKRSLGTEALSRDCGRGWRIGAPEVRRWSLRSSGRAGLHDLRAPAIGLSQLRLPRLLSHGLSRVLRPQPSHSGLGVRGGRARRALAAGRCARSQPIGPAQPEGTPTPQPESTDQRLRWPTKKGAEPKPTPVGRLGLARSRDKNARTKPAHSYAAIPGASGTDGSRTLPGGRWIRTIGSAAQQALCRARDERPRWR